MSFIDLHSHLLPGIDDGCVSIEESLACIRRLMANGFVGTVCTPHILPDIYPHNTPEQIAPRVAALAGRLHQEGIDYQLWPGGEVRLDADTLDWFATMGVPTLGPSRHVLVDFWGERWPSYGTTIIDWLLTNDYQPILAHPERMDFRAEEWMGVLDELAAKGVWLQGNLNSLSGGEGARAQERSWQLLTHGRYALLATDMHRPHQLDGRMAGIGLVRERAEGETVNRLLQQGPQAIVSDT